MVRQMKGLSVLIAVALMVLAHQLARHMKKPRLNEGKMRSEPVLTLSNRADAARQPQASL